MSKRLLLVGAGHSHLEVLRGLIKEPQQQVDICIISPSIHQYYSGMFSGYTEGLYSEEDIRINIKLLANEAGVHFIEKRVVELRPRFRKVVCHDGSVYPFDVISFDIGSLSLPDDWKVSSARTIKPNYKFMDQIEALRDSSHPLVVGGGAGGVEMALSLQAYKERQGQPGQVRLVSADHLLPETSKRTSKKMKRLLSKKRVQVWENERVVEVQESSVLTNLGNKIRHTGVIWLGGARSNSIFSDSGVHVDDKGFPYVRSTLQFQAYDYIFGAGDCVTLNTHPHLPKSGVYAVRQGPVLWENLKRYLKGEELITYQPQKNTLYILSTGNEKGFLIYGPVSSHSHHAWKTKNKIDQDFINKYK